MQPLLSRRHHLGPCPEGLSQAPEGTDAIVVGGGLAGVAAATILAERGVKVTLLEKQPYLGGRVGAWTDRLADDTPYEMERGFHAFFRQYYNLRALMRRVDPSLSQLIKLNDYPILGPDGESQSFADLPRSTPLNIIALTRRSKALGLRDLLRVNKRAAIEMLAFDPDETYAKHDSASARDYLDSLCFPEQARRLLFDVFAHSFFNPEEDMSAGELLMMFHFYFTGNPEGLVFDVLDRPFSDALWTPFESYLRSLGVDLRLGEAVEELVRDDKGYEVRAGETTYRSERLVLALPVAPLKRLVLNNPSLQSPRFTSQIESLDLTLPFAVLRLWLDREIDRPPFVGTTGVGILDNISVYDRFEDESIRWREETGGSILELHAYAVPQEMSEEAIREDLIRGMHAVYPETREATFRFQKYLLRHDCPAFRPGSHRLRPEVQTPFPGLALAGDFIKLPFPSALMERATSSGFMAANHLLAPLGVCSEPLASIPERGLLAPLF